MQTLEDPLASEGARKQLLAIQNIVERLNDSYNKSLRTGQSLSPEFYRVALAAANDFTQEQKQRIRDQATIKAIREFPGKLNINDHTPKNMADFLRHCFTDSCGHALLFMVKQDLTNNDAIKGIGRALMINTVLDENEANYRLILGEHIKNFPALDDVLKQFRSSVRDMNDAIANLAESLKVEPASVSAMSKSVVEKNLRRDSATISHISHIVPSAWRAEPFSL